ncbi:MAG: cytochrome c oxidase accessory protein CcoG [Alphaproteobacteria bacterium]|nr:cytochrome c oxidase accessory protein CcoG [Alphaproteobacteria bacterium]
MGHDIEDADVAPVNSKEHRELYKARVKIFPKKVSGTFRRFKWLIMLVTLGIYYITPWIRWDRGPFAPDQAVLVDLDLRRFYFFGVEIWPQEFFYVGGMLIMAGIGLFLVTSVVGRAWCGYTCPQTVWVDLFLAVERVIDGDRNAQMKLDKGPWSVEKVWKRVAKHGVWLLIAVGTGGAWVFYFTDAPTLARELVNLSASSVAYSTIAVLTATTYVFGGLMREQVCTYMCPWPRVQAAMLDEDSLIVTYNDWRGEPRGKHAKKAAADQKPLGDCVDCNQCVAVCPMGIDIRDGQQLECITCALCIDACDTVMDKLGRDRGLISYATLRDYNTNTIDVPAGKPARHTDLKSMIRIRPVLYFLVWSAIGLGLVFALATRDRLDLNVLRDRNPVYTVQSDGSVRNGYTVKILNMEQTPRSFFLTIDGLEDVHLWTARGQHEPLKALIVDVPADRMKTMKIFVEMDPKNLPEERTEFQFRTFDMYGSESAITDTIFQRPE